MPDAGRCELWSDVFIDVGVVESLVYTAVHFTGLSELSASLPSLSEIRSLIIQVLLDRERTLKSAILTVTGLLPCTGSRGC